MVQNGLKMLLLEDSNICFSWNTLKNIKKTTKKLKLKSLSPINKKIRLT